MCKIIRNSCFYPSFLYKLLVFALASVFFSPVMASPAQVTLTWDKNNEPDVAGYRIFCRQEDQDYDYNLPVWDGVETTCTIFGLDDNTTCYFVARAYDIQDNESGNSNEVRYQPEDNDQPIDIPPQIISDNGDAGASYTGTWKVSSGANPYGDRSLYSNEVNATYTFEAGLVGSYEVSLWWTYWSNRCTSVPVEIYDGETLLDTVEVNQKANAGKWNPLGTYVFSGTARVVIISEGGCTTSADAVKFLSALSPEPPELDYIKIEGPQFVNESSTARYTCTAHYTDGSSNEVEPDMWEENSDHATISPTGLLTTSEVTSSETCWVSATYEENGISWSDDLDITIQNNDAPVVPELDYIEIEGPQSVDESSTARYTCKAHYTDGSSNEVEPDMWEENSDHATISPTGLLTTSEVTSSETCWVSATYEENGISRSDDLDITIQSDDASVEVVIDNGDSGTSSTGRWYRSGGAPPIGDDNLYSETPGSTYTYQASINGYCKVYLHWTYRSSRCTSVPVRIYDENQLVWSGTVNQKLNGSQWNMIGLGGYTFSGIARVVIEATSSSCSTCADAVRFLSALPNDLPELDYIEIEGPQSVDESSSTQYFLRAYYTNGANRLVSPDNCDVDCTEYAEITSEGGFETFDVDEDQQCQIRMTHTEGDITRTAAVGITIRDFVYAPTVIIDNDKPGTSYTGGPWGYSSGADPYGGSSRTEMARGATYTFKAAISGSYEVSLWWTYWPSRCTNVPVDIYDGITRLDTVWVNHQENDGQWNLLGAYFFSSGTARVVIRSESNSCSTCADAVRFEP